MKNPKHQAAQPPTVVRSDALYKRAVSVIPGGVSSPVRAYRAVGGTPRFIARGAGQHVTDADGNTYLDLVNSWGALILGHAHPAVVAAITEAAGNGTTFGAPCAGEVELAERIVASYAALEQVRFVSSGTEAVMSAIRLARAFSGAPGRGAAGNQFGVGWSTSIYPYVKSNGLYKCADDSTSVTTNNTGTYYPVSYFMNSNIAEGGAGVSDAQFNAVASTVVIGECTNVQSLLSGGPANAAHTDAVGDGFDALYDNGGINGNDTPNPPKYATGEVGSGDPGTPQQEPTGQPGIAPAQHSGNGANYLLADGHAKFLKPSQVSPGINALQSTDAAGQSAAPATNLNAAGTGKLNNYAATFSTL